MFAYILFSAEPWTGVAEHFMFLKSFGFGLQEDEYPRRAAALGKRTIIL